MNGWKRRLLVFFLVVETPILAWLTYQWSLEYGFWGGIWHWIESGFHDPLQAATVIDTVLFIAWTGILILEEFPREGFRRSPFFPVWCFVYLVFPSLGLMSYLLWFRRRGKPALPGAA